MKIWAYLFLKISYFSFWENWMCESSKLLFNSFILFMNSNNPWFLVLNLNLKLGWCFSLFHRYFPLRWPGIFLGDVSSLLLPLVPLWEFSSWLRSRLVSLGWVLYCCGFGFFRFEILPSTLARVNALLILEFILDILLWPPFCLLYRFLPLTC